MKTCKWCNENPVSVNAVGAAVGDECDRCWELRMRIESDPELACKMVAQLTPLALDAATARANFPTCDRALRSEWVALATPPRK